MNIGIFIGLLAAAVYTSYTTEKYKKEHKEEIQKKELFEKFHTELKLNEPEKIAKVEKSKKPKVKKEKKSKKKEND